MFSIIENIYVGWQYLMNIVSLVGGNVGTLLNQLPKISSFITGTLSSFGAPSWVVSTAISFVSLTLLAKICHWGCNND